MSDETLDALAEAARNRGLKLVRSRVRTPGKRRFGKVGLTDARGKPVFGMDDKGPAAKPEDVAEHLRNLGARDWGASLDVAVLPRKRRPAKRARTAANDTEPARKPAPPPKPPKPPKPRPEPKLRIRDAKPSDVPLLTELIRLLGHQIDEKSVRKNLAKLAKTGEPPLVATLDKKVVGQCGFHRMTALHRKDPVGRITLLVVSQDKRREGIGRTLVEAAEARLRKLGCGRVEITVGDRRSEAQGFYRHLGYDRDSIRYFKYL